MSSLKKTNNIYGMHKKLVNVRIQMSKKCRCCGHRISFYAFEADKKICNWCGNLNYRNGLVEFKDKFRREEKRGNEV